jgi:hypothetical protein
MIQQHGVGVVGIGSDSAALLRACAWKGATGADADDSLKEECVRCGVHILVYYGLCYLSF